jgi:hypothetical protein
MLRRAGEPPPPGAAPPRWPAPHGYEHDSPVVTGNTGMFYRDGQNRGDPYTWAEFLQHLQRRVKADRQPALVRAKYGVGFYLEGGDMPRWAFDPDAPGSNAGATLAVQLDDGTTLDLPRAQILEPLDMRELRDYQRRLAGLIALGEAEPTTVLSTAAARALWRLGVLEPPADAPPEAVTAADDDPAALFGTDMGPGWGKVLRTDQPAVRAALHAFRELVGKAEPDDPAHADLMLPAERVALEVYGARIERLVAAHRAAAEAGQDSAATRQQEPAGADG